MLPKTHVVTCLVNFLIAALMGLTLRYVYVGQLDINYRFLTHAHSHVAMLGWVYLMLYVLILHYFVPEKKAVFKRLFWLTQCAVIGMMLSFPFQGYAAISISFSTLHIFCSYYFAYLIWKNHKTKWLVAQKLLKASLVFMLLSTAGVWCLGPAVSMLGNTSAFYQIAIQFFLHFQFNGWFLIAAVALLFYRLKVKPSRTFNLFYKLLCASTILTLALPVYWFVPLKLFLWINGLGVVLQLWAFWLFYKIIKPYFQSFVKKETKISGYMFGFAMLGLTLKIGMQSLSIIPEIAQAAYQQRYLVIGFIHLLMLGAITGVLFGFVFQERRIKQTAFFKTSIVMFVMGFVLTEFLLILQGGMFYFQVGVLPCYFIMLFVFSALLPMGIAGIIISVLRGSKKAIVEKNI